MENGKRIDAACIGYDEQSVPCERELQDLGEWSACTVVATDIEVDEEGDIAGTVLISFGPDYSDERKIDVAAASKMAEVVNDVIDRRKFDIEGCDGDCENCEGAKYDGEEESEKKLVGELEALAGELSTLLGALGKNGKK